MENQVKKSLEFKFLYDGFVYHLSSTTNPKLPKDLAGDPDMVYFIENGGETRLGYLRGNSFIECEDSIFIRTLMARTLELLMMPGDTGNYKE